MQTLQIQEKYIAIRYPVQQHIPGNSFAQQQSTLQRTTHETHGVCTE